MVSQNQVVGIIIVVILVILFFQISFLMEEDVNVAKFENNYAKLHISKQKGANNHDNANSDPGKKKESKVVVTLSKPTPQNEPQFLPKLKLERTRDNNITVVFAIFDIKRKSHMGVSGKEYTFVSDYVAQLNKIIREIQPCYVKVFMEKQYSQYLSLEPHYEDFVSVTHYEVEELRKFRYYDQIEKIRNDPNWIKFTPWLIDVPQGYSDLYNPIVMQKIYFTKLAAEENVFNTTKFLWLDSGGICVPTIPLLGFDYMKHKLSFWLRDDKFFITRSPYPGSQEIHGCPQQKIVKITDGYRPQHVCKGWIMGGTHLAIDQAYAKYDEILNRTLSDGCLGTEETVFTITHQVYPDLFNIFSNAEPFNEWADNVCKFFVEPVEDQTLREQEVGWL